MAALEYSTRWIKHFGITRLGIKHFGITRFALASIFCLGTTTGSCVALAQDKSNNTPEKQLGSQLDPWLAALQLRTEHFTLSGSGSVPIDNKVQQIDLKFVRHSDAHFELVLSHPEYALTLVRSADLTAVVLPKHRKVFWGQGDVDTEDNLETKEFLKRTIKGTTQIAAPFELIKFLDGNALADLVLSSNQVKLASDGKQWLVSDDVRVSFNGDQESSVTKTESCVGSMAREWLFCMAPPNRSVKPTVSCLKPRLSGVSIRFSMALVLLKRSPMVDGSARILIGLTPNSSPIFLSGIW